MTDKIVEPFWSSFSGNTRQYCFNTNNMFGISMSVDWRVNPAAATAPAPEGVDYNDR